MHGSRDRKRHIHHCRMRTHSACMTQPGSPTGYMAAPGTLEQTPQLHPHPGSGPPPPNPPTRPHPAGNPTNLNARAGLAARRKGRACTAWRRLRSPGILLAGQSGTRRSPRNRQSAPRSAAALLSSTEVTELITEDGWRKAFAGTAADVCGWHHKVMRQVCSDPRVSRAYRA